MAHHIATLIKDAEKERSPAKRKRAEKEATETILKVWEHRESLPSYAYPLAPFDFIFRVLDRLLPDTNPFRRSQDSETEIDRLAAVLFDNLSRFIICLLLMKPLSLFSSEKIDEAVIEALDEDEKQVWETLHKWNEIFRSDSASERRQPGTTKITPVEIDFRKRALDFVIHIKDSIEEVEIELQKLAVSNDVVLNQKKGQKKKTPIKRGALK